MEDFDLVVVGAGIAGLVGAYQARKKGLSVQVLEGGDRAGGVVQTEEREGFLLELGPNTILPTPELIALIDELGLATQTLFADPKLPRYVLLKGKLCRVPTSPQSFLTSELLSIGGRLRMLAEPLIPTRRSGPEETLAAFGRRRLGAEAVDRLLAPFVAGTWAGDVEMLSAESAFPKMVRWEQEHGSVLGGLLRSKPSKTQSNSQRHGFVSFINGMESLTTALASSLGNEIQYNATVTGLTPPGPGSDHWIVETPDEKYRSTRVLLATPAPDAAGLVSAFSPEAEEALRRIPYAPAAVIHLICAEETLSQPLEGFGYLVPPSENGRILGCLFSSNIFPGRAPDGYEILTVYMGGARQAEILEKPDEELIQIATEDVQKVLRLEGGVGRAAILRHDLGIPQYTLGHPKRRDRIAKAETQFPGLRFTGNYLYGISVGDVIKHATSCV